MSKNLLILLLTHALVFSAQSQDMAYYHALYLRGHYSAAKTIVIGPDIEQILKKYYREGTAIDTALLNTNPFFRGMFEVRHGAAGGLAPSWVGATIGSLDVTNIADAFAKFLVKRTKEELSIAFFDRFRELIHRPEYKDARTVFPQTCVTLDAIGNQIYDVAAFINALRESFEKDLNGLLPHVRDVIKDDKYSSFFNKQPALRALCLSGLYIGNGLLTKQHPGQILADFPVGDLKGLNQDVIGAVQTLQLFSGSLRSVSPGHYWVSRDSLRLLVEDNITLNIYLGLIYQKADNVRFEHETFQAFLKSMAEQAASAKLTSVKDYLSGFIEKAEVVTRSIQNISGRDRDKLSFTDYYEFYNSALDLVGYAATAYRFPGISEQNDRVDVGDNFARYLQYARTGSNIAMDISRRNYSSAIINTYTLYEKAFGGSDGGVRDTTDRFKGFMLKYGSFMAAVSQAQSSDDVESAIEAVALPAGSARIKRESCFNIALNAYAGLFYGREMIGNVDDHFSVYGVAAPIGFSLSKGHSFFFVGTGDCGWSTSLFVSLIDIGAVASFRFIGKNDSVAQAPTIQLKDIISPGLFLSVGFPKVPLSLNVGSQLGPNLRTVTSTTNTYEDKLYLRWSLSLCVDIPVINFFTTPRD